MYSLCRRAFGLPQNHLHPIEGDVRFSVHASDEASFRQAARYSIRPHRSPASRGLGLKDSTST